MCLSFRQLHFNYDNSLVKTNANNHRTLLFKGINFLFLFCFPSAGSALKAASSLLTPDCLHPPPKATPIHILTNTGLRLISSHTHTSLPPIHPTQHLWLITSKEDAIFQKRNSLRQILAGTPTVPVRQSRRNFRRKKPIKHFFKKKSSTLSL